MRNNQYIENNELVNMNRIEELNDYTTFPKLKEYGLEDITVKVGKKEHDTNGNPQYRIYVYENNLPIFPHIFYAKRHNKKKQEYVLPSYEIKEEMHLFFIPELIHQLKKRGVKEERS